MKTLFDHIELINDNKARSMSFFCKNDIVSIDSQTIDLLIQESRKHQSCDVRISLHKSPEETFHNMIILQNKGNYYRPHKHTNKEETYHIINGKMIAFIFNDHGEILQFDALSSTDKLMYRIPKNTWHVSYPLSQFVVFHESKPGPFIGQKETIFANWAPDGTNLKNAKQYIEKLMLVLK